jgi:hypothetical protein
LDHEECHGVVEPLSLPLRRWLFELKLVTPRQLARCRRAVLRLSRDLPAFDSVWLDALVQRGYLTPYQARILEAGDAGRLCIGPWVIVDRVAGAAGALTFRVRPVGGGAVHVARVVPRAGLIDDGAADRFARLIERLNQVAHRAIVGPHTCRVEPDRWVLFSRYVPGISAAEMLVRRGRFPPQIAWEAGRQLLDGLCACERAGLYLGRVSAGNVRISKSGEATLVGCGIAAALQPQVSVHAGLDVEACDGLAPERIGTGRPADGRSEVYALGSLLWQLLAGRPPFPGADPLVKLAACQTRDIPDVRQYAPETPAPLAAGIRMMTSRDPEGRPASFSEILARWGQPTATGRRKLTAFRRRFEAPAAASHGARLPALAGVAALLLAAIALIPGIQGARGTLLAWSRQIAANLNDSSIESYKKSASTRQGPATAAMAHAEQQGSQSALADLVPIPAPDPSGQVLLEAGRQYRADRLAAVGRLTIRALPGSPPEVVVARQSWKLSADSVRLEGVIVRLEGSADQPAGADAPLVLIRAQHLSVSGCHFRVGAALPAKGHKSAAAVRERCAHLAWMAPDPKAVDRPQLQLENSVFVGGGAALRAADAYRVINIANCLWVGRGPLLEICQPSLLEGERKVRCTATTCRTMGALFAFEDGGSVLPAGRFSFIARDCVFELQDEQPVLFELRSDGSSVAWFSRLRLSGRGSLVSPLAAAARRASPTSNAISLLEEVEPAIEGLAQSHLEFAGLATEDPRASELREFAGPRTLANAPGIDASKLPGARARD